AGYICAYRPMRYRITCSPVGGDFQSHAFSALAKRKRLTVPRGQAIRIPSEGLHISVERAADPGEKPARWVVAFGGQLQGETRGASPPLPPHDGPTRRLPDVWEPFLALRKRLFCSPACLQKHHDRKKIEKRKTEKKGGAR